MKRILAVIAVVGLAVILHVTRPDFPGPGGDCELVGAGIARQPGNAATSLVLVVAGLALARSGQTSRRLIGAGVLLAGVSSTLAHATLHPVALTADGVAVTGALLLGALAVARSTVRVRRLATAAALGAGSVALWGLSRSGGLLCDPDGILTGHAAWHVLVAIAALIAASSLTDREARTNF